MARGNDHCNRRDLLKLGIGGLTAGLFGEPLIRAVSADARRPADNARAVIYVFLSGGPPQRLPRRTRRVLPRQFPGVRGPARAPWSRTASPFRAGVYGAYPEYPFTMQPEAPHARDDSPFGAPNLSLPPGVSRPQLDSR